MKWYEDKLRELPCEDREALNEYLTPREVMELLYIGRNAFYKLVNSGALPAVRVGKQWRVRREDLYQIRQTP